jgi:hypothetical protein
VKRWLKIGGALLLLAWAPFVYQELTSEPAEKKERALPGADAADDEVLAGAHVPKGTLAGTSAEVEAPGQPAAEPEPAPEPAAAPEQPAAEPSPAEARIAKPAAEPEAEPEPVPEPAAEGNEEAEEEPAPPPVASGPTAVMKQAYETQPRDALWAKDTEARVAQLFGQDDVPQGMLERASCRRAVCRVDVRWKRDTAAQYVSAFQAIREQFAGEVAVEPVGQLDEATGQQQVHLYVLRKGYTASDLSK